MLDAVQTRFAVHPYRRALPVLLGTLAIYGFSFADRIDFAAIVSAPSAAKVDASQHFLFSSPLWVWLGVPAARLLGPTGSYAVTIGVGLCALAPGLWSWLRSLPKADRPAALAGLQLSPTPVVILSWLGEGHALLVGPYLLHAARPGAPARFALAAAMVGVQQEIGTVVLLSDALLRRRVDWPTLAGLLAARAGVAAYQAEVEGLVLTRAALGLSFAVRALQDWDANPVAHLALGIGRAWLLVVRRWRDDGWPALLASIALAWAASAVVADFTRVTMLRALPALVQLARREAADPAWLVSRGVACVCLVQLQLADFDLPHDGAWPGYAVKSSRGMS